MTRRQERLNELLRETIAEIVAHELKDPRLDVGLISITEVDVSADLRHARVAVSVLAAPPAADLSSVDSPPPDRPPADAPRSAQDAEAEAVHALEHSRAYIRRLITPRLKTKTIPELHFEADHRIAESRRLSDLIDALGPETAGPDAEAPGDPEEPA